MHQLVTFITFNMDQFSSRTSHYYILHSCIELNSWGNSFQQFLPSLVSARYAFSEKPPSELFEHSPVDVRRCAATVSIQCRLEQTRRESITEYLNACSVMVRSNLQVCTHTTLFSIESKGYVCTTKRRPDSWTVEPDVFHEHGCTLGRGQRASLLTAALSGFMQIVSGWQCDPDYRKEFTRH